MGPALFSFYMLPLYAICKKHNVAYHCYADDTQCYVPLHPKDSLQYLFDCLRADPMRCNVKAHDLRAHTVWSNCQARFMCSHYTCEILVAQTMTPYMDDSQIYLKFFLKKIHQLSVILREFGISN